MKAKLRDVEDTAFLISKFSDQNQFLSLKKDHKKGLRTIAFQQFWHQEKVNIYTFLRQIVLYKDLKSSFDIDSKLIEDIGISALDFLKISFSIQIYLSLDKLDPKFKYDGTLNDDFYDIFMPFFPKNNIDRYLENLTLKYTQQLDSVHKMANEALQLYETNFWSNFPFVNHSGRKQVLHKSIFDQTCKYYIYNHLKMSSPGFTEEFGRRLERYIELGLKECGVDYVGEKKMKKDYKLTKVCDYMVEDEILIECKAIELQPRSAILREPAIMGRDLKDTIVKAYVQMLSSAISIDARRNWWGIVVTYKKTFVGFGEDAWQEFLKEPVIKKTKDEKLNLNILPPERFCVIDIETWESVIQIVRDGKISMLSLIRTILTHNSRAKKADAVLLPEQALFKNYDPFEMKLSYLDNASEKLDFISDL
ncbi:MAG: hypothetical protein RIG77_17900 [Cyclobacteriaceae bacterium]